MKTITVKMIREHSPCDDPTEINGVDEKTSMTLLEWMSLRRKKADGSQFTNAHKVWLATRKGFMTELQHRKFAIWCARRIKTDCKEIKDYIDVIEKYYILKTATKDDLRVAGLAAHEDAAEAAGLAASAAYTADERKKQVRFLKQALKGGGK